MIFNYSEDYKFTEKWFDPMIPSWDNLFKKYLQENSIKNVLEVGCYEGRATIYLLSEHLDHDVDYEVVDTFGGSLEESGMAGTSDRLAESDFIYNNFIHNTSFHKDINLNVHRDSSQVKLPQLYAEGRMYDFIYIDASHRADDTFVDAYYAHKMLRPGGLIIFDDFLWKDTKQPHVVASPEAGVRFFATMYDDSYQVVLHGYQLGLVKRK